MSPKKVLVFGAAGAVGGAAALEAHKRGGLVFLAMRDPSKATSNLPKELPRIKADLTDPQSIEKAVEETGAISAFVYVTHGTDMKPAANAFKRAGIQHVVLLSSFSVYPDHEFAVKDNEISKIHAEAEIALEEAGLEHTDIRPMYFTSNVPNFFGSMIKTGEVYIYNTNSIDDYIAPEDIGAVAGIKLLSDEPEIIALTGPELMTKREALKIVSEEIGRDLKVVDITGEQFIDGFAKAGQSPELAKVLIHWTDKPLHEKYPDELCSISSTNVKKYTGRDSLTLREWVRLHKEEFL